MSQNWITEDEESILRYSYAVDQVLFEEKSPFQQIKVVDSKAYGRMLFIDDVVMLSEQDEFVYHEIMGHVSAGFHPNPKSALIIGGGDGGSIRELAKHSSIERIVLCEIDALVVETCKKYFPTVASDFDDPRVEVQIADGIEYIKAHKNQFDIILVDSTDPVGPGEVLFTKDFYNFVFEALRKDGLMIAQTESPWGRAEMLQKISANIQSVFPKVRRIAAPIPTYPRGFWSFTVASKSDDGLEHYDYERMENHWSEMNYLSPEMIPGIFSIPAFFKRRLGLH